MGRKPKTTGPTARNNPEAFKQVVTLGLDNEAVRFGQNQLRTTKSGVLNVSR